ncbi:hypothetical protein JZ751_002770 [Albula glossodonta]|uniref:CLASP N-terminal domain-containing protein n=1 Tax=Albula glossodonta TaxID=121402 RepID=A0A8T2N7V1_9TELE|nr:hypothetical protein JZ751_002770 [Albula glossodonta]
MQEKMKLSKSAKDKMRQRRLEQQEILHEQAEQQRVEKVHQGLRQSVSHFSIDELDTLKDWQLNGNELMKGQAESPPEDSPSSSTSPQGTLSPVKSFSPHHQPSPPTLPPQSKTTLRRVMNLRSGVSRVAVATLGSLYTHLQRGMDQELEVTATALLHKVGVSNTFIRHDVDAALDSMVQNCTHTRVMNALLTGGVRHLNSMVRKCTAQHLADLVEKIGAGRLLSGSMDLTDRILPAIARLAQDSSQEASRESAEYNYRAQAHNIAERTEYIKQLKSLMSSKDFRERIKAIDQVVGDCENNPDMVIVCIFPIFVTKAQLLSGRAKVNLVDKVADLVTELYPHKPLAVEQKVLPLLWNLLSTSSNSGTILGRGGSVREATATLCQALYTQMGPKLTDCAASQSLSVTKSLNQLLKTSPPLMISSE